MDGAVGLGPDCLELRGKLRGPAREPALILGKRRRFARLLAEHDLVIDQVEDRILAVLQRRVLIEVLFDHDRLAPQPASPLIVDQSREIKRAALRARVRLNHG
jgi:hypothetical protein